MRKFNLYFALISVILDAVMIWFGLLLAYQVRAEGGQLFLWSLNDFGRFFMKFIPVWLVLLAYQGLYQVRTPVKGWSAFAKVITALLSGWGVILIYLYLSRSPESVVFPRLIIAYGLVTTPLFVLAGRFLLDSIRKDLNDRGIGLIRTVVVTKSLDDPMLYHLARPGHAREIRGAVTGNFLHELNELSRHRPFDEIIVAWPDLDEREVLAMLDWAESHFVNFVQVPTILSVKATNVETGTLAGTPVIFYKQSPLDGWGRIFKRLLDLAIVIPSLIILSPLLFLLYLAAQLSTGSGIIRQQRVGQDGQTFFIHKFRSMYVDWPERFPKIKDWSADESTDPRITPVGGFLRRTNLDELPQLWDILVGTMSLVGPRPEQPKYVQEFSRAIPAYVKRHHFKSGLTGWAQINGLRGNTSVEERIKYDLFYIEHWSIWFDLRIIVATFIFMCRKIFA